MDQATFEDRVFHAVRAKPRSGAKWHPFEDLFREELGIRASGALNNSQGDTRTRADQLFKSKTHHGFESEGRPRHAVFVFGKEAAKLDRDSEEGLDGEIDETELESIETDDFLIRSIEMISLARPVFPQGEGTRSVLVLRCETEAGNAGGEDGDPVRSEEATGAPVADDAEAGAPTDQPTDDEEENGEEESLKLIPRALLVWEEDEVTEQYREWYPDIPIIRLGSQESVNVVIASGELPSLSDDPECPLVGLDESFEVAAAALRAGKHVVLYGPPGTGKTDLAEYLCRRLVEEPPNHFDFATATSDWTTFDVIGGYLPDPTLASTAAGTVLDFVPGVVTRALETGRWLILDELNRADIDKAFGELFTLLSDKPVRLAYKKRVEEEKAGSGTGEEEEDPTPRFADVVLGEGSEEDYEVAVPGQWRMIGTMNTFDKASLFRLSFAFMRRFAFVEVPVPGDDDFRTIIEQRVDTELDDQPDEVQSEVQDRVSGFFVDHLGPGARVPRTGPAVAIDVVKYCDGRFSGVDLTDGEEVEATVTETVLEGIETHLFPQFEGRDRDHEEIVEVLEDAFGLEEDRVAKTSRRLGVWTGYEPDRP